MSVRLLQTMKLKNVYRKSLAPQANDYPVYYRLCHDAKVLHAIRNLNIPVSKIDFFYIPNVQWDTFFPPKWRALAHIVDRLLVLNLPSMSNIFLFRIEKAHGVQDKNSLL
jgi:hypothetical protein